MLFLLEWDEEIPVSYPCMEYVALWSWRRKYENKRLYGRMVALDCPGRPTPLSVCHKHGHLDR